MKNDIFKSYEKLAKFYDFIFNPASEKSQTRKEIRAIKNLLKELNKELQNSIVVDLGGGTGRLAYPLSQLCKKVILVEPIPQMIDNAKKKLNEQKHGEIEFRQEGFLDISLLSNSVDVVLSFGGPFQYLLTLEDQLTALKNIYSILKPGGFVLIDLKNFFSLIKGYQKPEDMKWETSTENYNRSIVHKNHAFKEIWEHKEQINVENKNSGETELIESTHYLKMFSPSELRFLFQQVGFKHIKIYPGARLKAKEGTRIWITGIKP